MRLTVHLFSKDANDPHDLLREPDRDDRVYPEQKLPLDFQCVAVGVFRRLRRPVWAEYIDEYFDVDWLSTVNSSVALLVRVADRWFAVTFGHARHLLRADLLVADFGLRVTANTVSGTDLRSISSIAMDGSARRTSQRVAVPSSTRAFSVDLVGEWVQSLGGWTDSDLTRGMTGSQALAVDLEPGRCELKQLHELLAHLLDRYDATDYREHFPFIDWAVTLHHADPRVVDLDAEVVRRLCGDGRGLAIMDPASQPGDDERYVYRLRRRRHPLDLFQARNAAIRVRDPIALRVEVVDSQGVVVGSRPLWEHLSAEIELLDGTHAVLAEGRWFLTDRNYLVELDRELAGISEWGQDRLDMPRWWKGLDEEAYNSMTAARRRWLLMDRRNFVGVVRQYDRIEVADMITPLMDLVCVKKMSGAGSLSHLFSQGSVSATLFAEHGGYRNYVEAMVRTRWPDALHRRPTIVFAIGLSRPRRLPVELPFFSRVNLRNHAQLIRGRELEVAVVRIDLTQFPDPLSHRIPEPRAEGTSDGALFDL